MIEGLETLKKNIKIAPDKPGVYRMIGNDDKVLYIGKAKNIKKRIVAYSHIEKLPLRLQRMVSEIRKMEFIIVENEAKALLMENELIKELSPKYNILLKDDKTFPDIMINLREEFPALRKHRGKKDNKNKYFGPFASAGAVNAVLDILQKAFLLRNCKDSFFKNRQRPCLMYQIKRCSAPCVEKISEVEYRKLANEAIDFLEGKNNKIQEELSQHMNELSDFQYYEQAMILRDRIRALTNIQQGNNVEYADIKSSDIVAIYSQNDVFCIQVFFIRSGQNCGNVVYFPKQTKGALLPEVLSAFLGSFYVKHIPPKEIVVSEDFEDREFLAEALGVKILVPQKGDKFKLVENARENAKSSLLKEVALKNSIDNNLKEMFDVFGLGKIPQRIEIYDNSHIQGSYAIGAMVVATRDGFDKKQYRTFNIKNSDITNDDFAMMKEVLARRFAKLTPENKPDVILIDGGLGQLSSVHDSLKNYDLSDIAIIAISKGPDRNAGKEFYYMKGRESFMLPFASALAFYLQNLRDEAHRFAIGTHRKKRGKSMYKSKLDEIDGIGLLRKKDLLNHFGSVEQISQASVRDIAKVKGISKKIAEKIYNHFNT